MGWNNETIMYGMVACAVVALVVLLIITLWGM